MGLMIQLCRLGRDAEVRYIPNGEAVATLSLAYNYGRKGGADQKKPTQWIECGLWGKRAEALAPYLLRGTRVLAYIEDVHIETFTKADNTASFKLAGRLQNLELLGDSASTSQDTPAPRGTAPQQPARQAPPRPAAGFDDADSDDIPF